MKAQSTAKAQVIKGGKLIYTEIIINATPDKIWQVLTDFPAYPEWNPFIKTFKGQPQVGGQVEVFLQQPGSKGMTFKPTILNYENNRELRWIGKLVMSYIFDGEHAFVLTDNNNGTTTFQQYEHFRGILVPFMKNMLEGSTLAGFKLMNEALKARVETQYYRYR